jgi:hypothetical protein
MIVFFTEIAFSNFYSLVIYCKCIDYDVILIIPCRYPPLYYDFALNLVNADQLLDRYIGRTTSTAVVMQ